MAKSKKPSDKCLIYLKRRFSYNPKTGAITDNIGVPNGTIKPGDEVGHKMKQGYIRIKYTLQGDTYRVLAHCLAWFLYHGKWPSTEVDHKNGIKTANWIKNLRLATYSQNQANRKVTVRSLTGVKGVSLRGGKYIAQIEKHGKVYHSPLFVTLHEARVWYQTIQHKLHKEFASHLGAEKGQPCRISANKLTLICFALSWIKVSQKLTERAQVQKAYSDIN